MTDFAKDIVNFADKLKLNNFYLIGHSFGAIISNEIAVLISDRLAGIIIMGH